MEDTTINIQIPINQLKDYIKSIFEEEIDSVIDDIASKVESRIEDSITDSITESVTDSVQEDLRNNFSDYFDVSDHIDDIQDSLDYSEIADQVQERLDIGSEIESLAEQFSPGHHCGIGKAVEEVIYDGVEYGLTHDEDFAKAMGSFIDNWLYQPVPNRDVQKMLIDNAINRILGREDASNIHNDLMPQTVENKEEIPASEREVVITAGDIHTIIDISLSHFYGSKDISIPALKERIITHLTTENLMPKMKDTN